MAERTEKSNATLTKFDMDEIVRERGRTITKERCKEDKADDSVAKIIVRSELCSQQNSSRCCQ